MNIHANYALSCASAALLFAAHGSALATGVPTVVPSDLNAEKVLISPTAEGNHGWAHKLSVGATASYNHSNKVVGAPDGATVQLGLIVGGHATLVHGDHTWENTLKIQETQTRTPQVPMFVKSADSLDVQSTYLYALPSVPWMGPYGRASVNTQILSGFDLRPEDATIVRILDGEVRQRTKEANTRIRLTRPFEPLLLRQSAGAFANPIKKDKANLKAKVGVGAQEILTRGGFATADDEATTQVEYKQLEDTVEAGTELELEAGGVLREGVSWETRATFFYPLLSSAAADRSGLDALNSDLTAKLSVKLAAWASLDYVFTAKRVPTVTEDWQVQNGVMLTSGFDLL